MTSGGLPSPADFLPVLRYETRPSAPPPRELTNVFFKPGADADREKKRSRAAHGVPPDSPRQFALPYVDISNCRLGFPIRRLSTGHFVVVDAGNVKQPFSQTEHRHYLTDRREAARVKAVPWGTVGSQHTQGQQAFKTTADLVRARKGLDALHPDEISHHMLRGAYLPNDGLPLPAGSAGFFCVGQAHTRPPAFWRDISRVGQPGAVIAAFGLREFRTGDDRVDSALRNLAEHVGRFVRADERLLLDDLVDLPLFMSDAVSTADGLPHEFALTTWNLEQALAWLSTWPSVRRARQTGDQTGRILLGLFVNAWGAKKSKRRIELPVRYRTGRLAKKK